MCVLEPWNGNKTCEKQGRSSLLGQGGGGEKGAIESSDMRAEEEEATE